MKIQQPWLRPDQKPHTKNLTKTKVNRKPPEISISFSCRIMRTGDGSGGKTISARKMRAFFFSSVPGKAISERYRYANGNAVAAAAGQKEKLIRIKIKC